MIPTRLTARSRGFSLSKLVWDFAALILFSAVPLGSAQNPAVAKNGESAQPAATPINQAAATPAKQTQPKNPRREKTKADAAELSALADQLRDQLNKMNVNVLSLGVLQRTEAIEKLAKKIKEEEADEH